MDKNYEYFVNNLKDLLTNYDEKFIVIKNQDVIASYDSFDEAYAATIKKEKLGDFIIQHCVAGALEPSAHFAWSNVTFSSVTA